MKDIWRAALSLARSHMRLRSLEEVGGDLLEAEKVIYRERCGALVALLVKSPINREWYLDKAAPRGEPQNDEDGLKTMAALLILENDPR